MIRILLNPYGIAYTLGIQGQGTPRASPRPWTVAQYLDHAQELGVGGVELHTPMLDGLVDDALRALAERLRERRWAVVLAQPLGDGLDRAIHCARILGAQVLRCHATSILCGDRAAPGCDWPGRTEVVRKLVAHWGGCLRGHGLSLAIENHQDFTSAELVELCRHGGENVGVCFDVGNALAVGEDPADFARAVAPVLKHVHLKDYRAAWTDEGYRLVRCPIGDGAVDFKAVLSSLDRGEGTLTASIEPGALSARHVRLLTASWWKHYPPRSAESLAAGLRAARVRRIPEDDEWRTPWELDADPDTLTRYELDQLAQSVANLKALGYLN